MQGYASVPGVGNLAHLQDSVVGADVAHEQWVLRNLSKVREEAGDALLSQLPRQLCCADPCCAYKGSFVRPYTLTGSSKNSPVANQATIALTPLYVR